MLTYRQRTFKSEVQISEGREHGIRNDAAAVLKGKLFICSVVSDVCLVVHVQELKERHFRNLGTMLNEMFNQDGKAQKFGDLGEEANVKDQDADSGEASHGRQMYPKPLKQAKVAASVESR